MRKVVTFLVVFLVVLIGLVFSQAPPPPSWDAVDIHVAIAGSQEIWISYKEQMSKTIQAEYYQNSSDIASWLYSVMNLQSSTVYVWAPAPKLELTACYQMNTTIGTMPDPLPLIVGDNFIYSGTTVLNGVSLYKWIVGIGSYDVFYENQSDRTPYAVYSIDFDTYYYFSAFEEVAQPPIFFSPPFDINCYQI